MNPLLVYLALEGGASLLFAMIFNVNMIYQVTVAQLNPLQLVLVGTTLETTVFLFEIPTGIVADLYSRRISVIIGYFLIGAGFILEGSLPIFGTILLAQLLWGLGYTFTSGATQAWISDEIGEAAVLAKNAGVDILLVCHSREAAARVFESLIRSAEKKEVLLRTVDMSLNRILKLKERYL